jgi:F-type H+-transporting ATPase subunit b
MKKLMLFSLVVIPAVLFAGHGGDAESSRYFAQTGRETDFWPRVVNFSIFVSLLVYLVAKPIKEFFNGRSQSISSQLSEIEEKLQAAKNEKKEAQNRLKESEKKAEQIIVDAKKEAEFLSKQIAEANKSELDNLEKQYKERVIFEERKSAREAIDEILSENITNSDINLDDAKVVDIISKKVA